MLDSSNPHDENNFAALSYSEVLYGDDYIDSIDSDDGVGAGSEKTRLKKMIAQCQTYSQEHGSMVFHQIASSSCRVQSDEIAQYLFEKTVVSSGGCFSLAGLVEARFSAS